MVEADNFGPTQATSKADQQDRPVAQAAQIVGEGCQHVAQVFRQNGLFLCWWPCVLAADASQDAGNVPIFAVEPLSALRIAPGQARQPPFYRGGREGRCFAARRCQIGDVEADQLGRRGERVRATHPAPAREVGPILGVGLQRVLRRRLTRIVTRRFDQAVERARASDMGGQGDRVALRISAVVPLMAIGTFRGF